MKTSKIIFIVVFAALTEAYASCGSSSCPLYINNPLSRGLLSLSFSHDYIYQDQVYTGSALSFVGAIPQDHDEVSTLNQITAFSIGYSLLDNIRFDLLVPYIHREHSHILNQEGIKIPESWSFTGIGDLVFTGSYSKMISEENPISINFNAGIKLPTGRTHVANIQGEEAEVTIQPGSGSLDYILGASISKDLFSMRMLTDSMYSAMPLTLSFSYRLNGKGTDNYRFGNQLMVHLSSAYRIIEKLSVLLQVNARFMEKADVGNTGEPSEDTGGKWVFLSPGLKYYLSDNLSLYSYYQIPLYQNYNGIQQAAPYNLQVGISSEFNLLN